MNKENSDFENACGFDKLTKDFNELKKKHAVYSSSPTLRIFIENPEILKMLDDLLKEGKEKYPNDQWKTISSEAHFKKAKGHLLKEIKGETSDYCSDHWVSVVWRAIFGGINKYKNNKNK